MNRGYFGLTDIFRMVRQAYTAMQSAMNPAASPPNPVLGFAATSQGYIRAGQEGCSEFLRDGGSFARVCAGSGGGRGFNIAVVDSTTGVLVQPVQSFDTWASSQTGTAMNAMVAFLQGLPNGVIVLISVADEAGLADPFCNKYTFPWDVAALAEFASLGATQIGNYCWRESWSMVSVKGEGTARAEQLQHGSPAPQAVSSATIMMK